MKYRFRAIKGRIYNEISEKSKDPAVLSTLKKEYLNYAVTMVLYAELAGSFGLLNESEPVAETKISVDNVSDSDLVGKTGAGESGATRYAQWWENLAKPGNLTNREARAWYLSQEGKIPGMLDSAAPLEQQAQQAFNLRNTFRTTARDLMSDRAVAAELARTEPNMTWSQIVQKYSGQGYSDDALWNRIIQGSQSSRASVNTGLGF